MSHLETLLFEYPKIIKKETDGRLNLSSIQDDGTARIGVEIKDTTISCQKRTDLVYDVGRVDRLYITQELYKVPDEIHKIYIIE